MGRTRGELLVAYEACKAAAQSETSPANPWPAMPVNLATHPRIIQAAKVVDVVEEQIEEILEHYRDSLTADSRCGCEMCERYGRIRVIAMEVFAEVEKSEQAVGVSA